MHRNGSEVRVALIEGSCIRCVIEGVETVHVVHILRVDLGLLFNTLIN